jgi:hypothetical protein
MQLAAHVVQVVAYFVDGMHASHLSDCSARPG